MAANLRRGRNLTSPRQDFRSVHGALALVGIALVAIAGLLAVVQSADAFGDNGQGTAGDAGNYGSEIFALLCGIVLLGCAYWAWRGNHRVAGAVAALTGIALIVTFPDFAGTLGLLGGLAILGSSMMPHRRIA